MPCSLGLGGLQCKVAWSDTIPWQVPKAFVCHGPGQQDWHGLSDAVSTPEVYPQSLTHGFHSEACWLDWRRTSTKDSWQ